MQTRSSNLEGAFSGLSVAGSLSSTSGSQDSCARQESADGCSAFAAEQSEMNEDFVAVPESEESQHQIFFFALFKALQTLHESISGHWEAYAAGFTDLVTVALSTTAALEYAEKMLS
jgi:hypothetical protein